MAGPRSGIDEMSGPHDLTGRTLDGRYRITQLLGEGGMGYVYEAIHTSLGRKVAIKTLHPRLAYEERFRERFLREAKSASSIQHPNVVQIMDFGDTPDGSVYFVMEHLEGRDLGSLLREQGKLPWARTREILVQAVRALRAAHAQSIIHRDIKPGNCFLAQTGARHQAEIVKLLDFGIAKVGSEAEGNEGAQNLTGTGEVFGTASYMAPEQARGEPLDARSDVYALGIMAYEMLTGQVPFTGVNAIHVITKHLTEKPRPPRTIEPSIPPVVEAVVMRAIAKERKDRFASMAELEAALLAIPAETASPRSPTLLRGTPSTASSRPGQAPTGAVTLAPRSGAAATPPRSGAAAAPPSRSGTAAVAPRSGAAVAPPSRSGTAAVAPRFGAAAVAPGAPSRARAAAPVAPSQAAARPVAPRAGAVPPPPPPRPPQPPPPSPAHAARPASPGVPVPLPPAARDPSFPSGSVHGVPMPLPPAAHDPSFPSGSVPVPLIPASYDPAFQSGPMSGVPSALPPAAYDSSYPSHPSLAMPGVPSASDVSGELGRGSPSGPFAVGGDSTRPPPGQADQPTSPSISMRAPSQTGSSRRATGSVADTSPHHLRTTPAQSPVRRVALVLGAIALVSVVSSGVALLVLRNQRSEASAGSAPTAGTTIEAERPPASSEAAKEGPAQPQAVDRGEEAEPEPPPGEAVVPVAPPSEALPPTDPATNVPADSERVPTDVGGPGEGEPGVGDEPPPSTKDADPWSKRPRYLMQTCVDRRARAQAAVAARQWKDVLSATGTASCWSLAEQDVRRGMRVQAYLGLGEFDKCVATGRDIDDKRIRAAVKTCEGQRAR